MTSVQQRHLDLAEAIETRFEVAQWRGGDADLWPLASMDLFLDMFDAAGGGTAPPQASFLRRAASGLAKPLTNAWRSRRDLRHFLPRPMPADAIFLGDGVSLDKADGAWRDRFGEPVMAALELQGRKTFLMQPGELARLPWSRPSFAANTIAVRAAITAGICRAAPIALPDHAEILAFLRHEGVEPPSLQALRLARRSSIVAAAASVFQRILRKVAPRIAFVVTYYAGLGHAFALACRREGILCVDLQHCPQEGGHRAYRWHHPPAAGYSTLPAMFWSWSSEDAARITQWAPEPWHQAVHGGHTQLVSYPEAPETGFGFEREILVALQPIGGRRAVWEALARRIEASPADWRWWIRRHPSASLSQDGEYRDLLALRRPNVVVEDACILPLPVLLRQMSVLVSLASGAAAEAASCGVPALFLDQAASGTFPGLIARGQAELVDLDGLLPLIAALPARPARPGVRRTPPIAETLLHLDRAAEHYARDSRKGLDRKQDLLF